MPAPRKASRPKHKAPQRRYELALVGELDGFHVTMGSPSGRELIRLRSGEMTEGEAIEYSISKIVDHDFDVDDLLELDAWILLEVSRAWSQAMKDAAVPPTPASS